MGKTFIRETKPEDLLCTVIAVRDRQATIQNNLRGIQDWDREYVEFSGYFGTHGPHVFAAAPELYAALRVADRRISMMRAALSTVAKRNQAEMLDAEQRDREAALAKATGQ